MSEKNKLNFCECETLEESRKIMDSIIFLIKE